MDNHVLADLSLGGGVLLPDFENSLYIFDECHHLPQRAISHFEKATPLLGFLETLDQLNATTKRAVNTKLIKQDWEHKIPPLSQEIIDCVKQLKSQLDINKAAFNEGLWHILDQDRDKLDAIKPLAGKVDKLTEGVGKIYNEVENSIKQSAEDNEKTSES